MIGIQLDGDNDFLETDENTSISIKLENPILGESDRLSPGSYSLPFDLPGAEDSPRNAAKLKNPDVIENNEAYQVQKANLFFGGVPFKTGTLKSSTAKGGKISNHFLFGLSQVDEGFKTAKLRDVVAETVIIDDTPISKRIYLKKIGSGDYKITLNGKSYTAASLSALRIAINLDYEATLDSGLFTPVAGEVTTGTTPSGLISSTYLVISLSRYYTYYDPITMITFFLSEVSTDPLHELHLTADTPADYQVESFDMDPYYDGFDAALGAYFTGPHPTERFRMPVVFNSKPHGDEIIKESELINGCDAAGIIRNDANWGLSNSAPFKVKNYNSLQPFARLKWVMDKIATAFNFSYEGDFYEDPDVQEMLLHNTASLDVPQNFIGDKKFVFWRRSFNTSELVPDMKVPEFFTWLRMRYNLAVYYNEATRTVRLQKREPIALQTAFNDITSMASPVQGNDDQRVSGYTIKVLAEDTDDYSTEESLDVGTPEALIEIKAGRIQLTWIAVIGGIAITGPRVSQKIGSKFGLRLFHYKGIITGGAFNYPKADINGDTITESLANDFISGSTGIYERFWKYWLHFQKNRRQVNVQIDFPFRKVIAINWEEKVRFDRKNMLIKSIALKLTNKAMKISEVELITMQ